MLLMNSLTVGKKKVLCKPICKPIGTCRWNPIWTGSVVLWLRKCKCQSGKIPYFQLKKNQSERVQTKRWVVPTLFFIPWKWLLKWGRKALAKSSHIGPARTLTKESDQSAPLTWHQSRLRLMPVFMGMPWILSRIGLRIPTMTSWTVNRRAKGLVQAYDWRELYFLTPTSRQS